METKPKDLGTLSKSYPRLETLINRVNYDSLLEEYRKQPYHKAVGVDGIDKSEYERSLEKISRMKTFSCRPRLVRRAYILKPNGDLRPLGFLAYEEKLVQRVMTRIFGEAYEPRFLGCSYDFRPSRNVHQALREVNQRIIIDNINYILDCDIKEFFL